MVRFAGLINRLPPSVRKALKFVPGMTALRDRLYKRPVGPKPRSGDLRPVVYLPTWVQWDVMRQRPQYILQALADSGHEVYFVDPTAVRNYDARAGIHVSTTLEATPPSDVIVYTHFAPTRTLLDRYERAAVVYDILDDLSIYDPDEIGLPIERTVRFHHQPIMSTADVVMASNSVLVDRHRPERADILLVENGVDPTVFRPDGSRVDLGGQPVIGYHGAIASWFDFDLLERVATERPDYSFVLVGPVMGGASDGMERLSRCPNVTHHPQAPVETVAAYVRSFVVGIIPFLVDTMTQGVTPLKLYEYLASGVPVVSTPLPACVAHPDVSTAGSAAEMAAALDRALAMSEGERDRLRSVGLAASWDRRVEPLMARLEDRGLRRVQ